MREDSEGRLAEEVQEREKRGHVHQMGILTVDASGAAARQESGDITWHEMVNATAQENPVWRIKWYRAPGWRMGSSSRLL